MTQIDYGKHEDTVKELDRQEKAQEYERRLAAKWSKTTLISSDSQLLSKVLSCPFISFCLVTLAILGSGKKREAAQWCTLDHEHGPNCRRPPTGCSQDHQREWQILGMSEPSTTVDANQRFLADLQ